MSAGQEQSCLLPEGSAAKAASSVVHMAGVQAAALSVGSCRAPSAQEHLVTARPSAPL